MKKKTYGVSGLMEWQARIHCGKAVIVVPFTGGTLTGYGVSPAEYTTDNVVVQRVIEGSDYFRSGRIRLLREIEIASNAEQSAKVEATAVETHEAPRAEGMENVSVASMEDARAYLLERFSDVSASQLRSKKAIAECARVHNIAFTGVELG